MYLMRDKLNIFSGNITDEKGKLIIQTMSNLVISLQNNVTETSNSLEEFKNFTETFSIIKFFKFVVGYSNTLLPFISITILELLILRQETNELLTKTSIGRIIKSEEGFADIWYCFLFELVRKIPLLAALTTLGVTRLSESSHMFLNNFIDKYITLPTSLFGSTILFIVGILIFDFEQYWEHKLSHIYPPLWDSHEFHHAATQMNIFAAKRLAPLDGVFFSWFTLPFTIIGTLLISAYADKGNLIPFFLVATWATLMQIQTFAGHSSFKVAYPKPFNYILLSPCCHLIHHSNRVEHYDKNFGFVFSIWDRFYGTYLDESNLDNIICYGIDNSEYNKHHPAYSFLILPVVKLARRFKNFFVYS